MAFTAQQLISRVQEDLHDTRATRRWDDDLLIDYINDGAIEIMMIRPESTSALAEQTTVGGVRQELPATAYRLLDILHNATIAAPGRAIRLVSMEELDSYTPHWRSATPAAESLEYTYDENDSRGFYLLPPAIAANTITTLVSKYPTPITVVGDAIPVRDEYFTALQYYVCWRCLNQDFEFTEANRAEQFYAKFTNALGMKNGGDNTAFPKTGQVPDRTS